jgi:hypothetical protein
MRPNLSLDQLVNHALAQAKGVLIGSSTAQLDPTFVIQFKDRPPAIMPAPFSDERQKSAFIAAIRAALKHFRPSVVSYSFLSEAWVAAQDHRPRAGDLMPSQRETRKECVLVSVGDHDGARMTMWEIVRDGSGRVVDLVAEKTPGKDARFEGRLFNLLDDDDA